MSTYKKLTSFVSDEEMTQIQDLLELMVDNSTYNTNPSFSANTEVYPDNLIPFIDKHMKYLTSHRGINPQQYVANLRLMTRIR